MSIHPVFVLRQHLGEIECTSFRGNELKLASGDNQGWVTVWDLDIRRPSFSIQPSTSSNGILSVAWVGSSLERVLVQSRGGIIRVVDSTQPAKEPVVSFDTEYEGFCKAQRISDSLFAFASSAESIVELWTLTTKLQSCLKLHPPDVPNCGSISCIGSSDTNDHSIFVGSESGMLSQWDTRYTNAPVLQQRPSCNPLTSIAVDPSLTRAIIGSCDSYFTGMKLKGPGSLRKVQIPEEGISDVKIRQDRVLFATGGWDAKVRLWKYRTLEPLAILKYHSREITSVNFSKSEKPKLVTGSRDGTIAVWNVYN